VELRVKPKDFEAKFDYNLKTLYPWLGWECPLEDNRVRGAI